MKTILVTGGAGFIGSNFIKYMLKEHGSYNIINLDLLTYAGKLENLVEIEGHKNYTFIKGNISNSHLVKQLFHDYGINYVVHFAAESHVDRSIVDPEVFVRTNILGTQVLLDCAKEAWTIGTSKEGYPVYREGVNYIQISTDEVYGSLEKGGFFTELTPLAPNSPYSASKASADLLVRAYYKTFKMPVNITRCSNNYGPNQDLEKLIPLMINNAMNDSILPVYGDGLQIRDWLYVEDHCLAIYQVMIAGKNGDVYNIGGNNEKTNIDLVKLILKSLNKPESLITYVQDRLGHDRRYAIDNSKISKELGWNPVYTFDDGIEKTIKWYSHLS